MNTNELPSGPSGKAKLGQPGRRRRWLRRGLLVLGIGVTVIALFYTEENWRGKRAWEACQRKEVAAGRTLSWSEMVPPSVPDDQNFFKAPNMQQWFTGRGGNALSARLKFDSFGAEAQERGQYKVADITVVPVSAAVAPGTDITLLYHPATHSVSLSDDKDSPAPANHDATSSNAAKQLRTMISAAVAASGNENGGSSCNAPSGFKLFANALDTVKPVGIVIRSDTSLSNDEIQRFFPTVQFPSPLLPAQVIVQSVGDNSFSASFSNPQYVTAADYLAWSDKFQPDFDAIHAALQRPYTRMDGNYDYPATIPIPNFVCVRIVAQVLAQRAQCYMLLSQPGKALPELLFIRDLCKLLEARPTGRPMTLVAAMINVAVMGLYVDTFRDGLRLHVWRESELAAIQEQLPQIDLTKYVYDALRFEAAAHEVYLRQPPARLADLFDPGRNQTLWQKAHDPVHIYCTLAPSGWIYQNAAKAVEFNDRATAAFDRENNLIVPKILDNASRSNSRDINSYSPYVFLAGRMTPNFSRAVQRLALNQTLVNEALVVCALERYRLAQGHYPKTLDELAPQFAEKIPADIIGGEPLKYRQWNEKFVLYSVGWNAKDDGGVASGKNSLDDGSLKNDWVWPRD